MKIATHNETFHGDDVFAIATLKMVEPKAEIVRTRDEEIMDACDLRVDVGLKNNPKTGDFDHHQPGGAGKRANGIPYASFGLVWKQYGAKICGSAEVAGKVDDKLVQIVDAHDNGFNLFEPKIKGMTVNTVDRSVSLFNPVWNEKPDEVIIMKAFNTAVGVASALLEREIAMSRGQVAAVKEVRAAVKLALDPRLVILTAFMPWREVIVNEAPGAQFVIFPRTNGWALQAIPQELGVFENRVDLPASWAGKQNEDLAKVTGVPDATFCHTGRFLAVAGSRAGVLELARLALK